MTNSPAPWTLCTNELDQEFNIVGADSIPVCTPYTTISSKSAKWSNKKLTPRQIWEFVANDREQANAKLIEAAPDLLAFAQEWLDRQGTDENYMTAKARAAIRKAQGE